MGREQCEGAGDAGRHRRCLYAAHEQQAWLRREEDLVSIMGLSLASAGDFTSLLEEQIGAYSFGVF